MSSAGKLETYEQALQWPRRLERELLERKIGVNSFCNFQIHASSVSVFVNVSNRLLLGLYRVFIHKHSRQGTVVGCLGQVDFLSTINIPVPVENISSPEYVVVLSSDSSETRASSHAICSLV